MDVRSLAIAIGFKVNNSNVKQVEQTTKKVKTGLERVGDSADKAGNKVDSLFSKLSGLAMFAGVSLTLGSIVKTIDEWKVIEGQVNNVTKSQQESKAVQKEIYNIASRTRQQYKSTAELYTSVARNAQELKKSTKDILLFTEDVSNAMLLGGGDASSQQAALVQLGQALGSGTLRGDELNSIMEQAPRLAKAIAEGMGTTIGQLRQMGSEGKLTAQDVFNAIRGQSDRLKMELGKMPWTVGQATNKMQNAIGKFFKEFEDKTGIIDGIAKRMAKFADYIENINLDNFISGLQIAAIYAGILFGMAKWSSFVMMIGTAVKWIVAMRDALILATGAQIAFNSQTRRGAAMQMLLIGKFLLIAAAIALVVLLIQDFYKWVTDPKADTMMKRWFGDFEPIKNKFINFKDSVIQWFSDIGTAIAFVPKLIYELFKLAFEGIWNLTSWLWEGIGNAFVSGLAAIGYVIAGVIMLFVNAFRFIQDSLTVLATFFADTINSGWQLITGFFDNMIKWVKDAIKWVDQLISKLNIMQGVKDFVNNNIINPISDFGSTAVNRLLGNPTTTNTSSNISNSGNTTNYIQVTTASTSPEATATAVGNVVSRNNGWPVANYFPLSEAK